MGITFTPANRTQAKVRLALHGASGSGKTYTALAIATAMGGQVAALDTEYGSMSKYAKAGNGSGFDFSVLEVRDGYHPDKVGQAIAAAAQGGFSTIIVDSLTHFWNGTGGFLDLADAEAKRQAAGRSGRVDTFAAWKVVTPIYNRMVHDILSAPIHVIVTMRSKTEYSRDGGKVTKVGTAPEIRDSFEYNLDIEGSMTADNDLIIGKSRCSELSGKIFNKPGKQVADILLNWCGQGAPVVPVDWAAEIAAAETMGALAGVGNRLKGDTAALTVFREAYMARKTELQGAANGG